MGYDVHLTRADFWAMNDDAQITAEEWVDVVRTDRELQLINDSDSYSAQWIGGPGEGDTYFEWHDGNVQVKNPTSADLTKLEEIAAKLRARIQGDDGEIYRDGQVVSE